MLRVKQEKKNMNAGEGVQTVNGGAEN